ncbi:MAG: PEP-CTERM sorting domain-containing protein, partial [Verrucomicrobiota bacterium]
EFDDGAINGVGGAYSLDTEHRIDIVINNSDSNLVYGGGETLTPRAADVWIDGALVVEDIIRNNIGTVTGFGFISGSTALQEAFVDNIQVSTIPEPGSGLLLLAGVGLLALRRTRRH